MRKENPGEQPVPSLQNCGSLCGSPYSDLISENLQGLSYWKSDHDGEGGRGSQLRAHWSWQIADYTCSAQVIILTGGFAHLQNAALWLGNLEEFRSTFFGFSQVWSFASPIAWFAHFPARSWVTAPPALESGSWPHETRGPGKNTKKLYRPKTRSTQYWSGTSVTRGGSLSGKRMIRT